MSEGVKTQWRSGDNDIDEGSDAADRSPEPIVFTVSSVVILWLCKTIWDRDRCSRSRICIRILCSITPLATK